MKRKWKYGLIGLLVFILFGSALAWLLGTESGARWLFARITQGSPWEIEAEGIRGRVWGNLRLDGLRVTWPSGEIRGQMLLLRWEPLYLLTGRIVLTELSLEDVRLQDHGTPAKKAPDLRWPQITGILSWLSVEARTFQIHRFELLRPDQPSLKVDDLSAQIQWQRGLLKLKEVTLRADSGLIAGTMEVDFVRPNLRLDLKGALPNGPGGVDTLLLKLQMAGKKDSETIGGPFTLVGQSGSAERLRCEGDLSLEKQGIFFRRLQLSQPGQKATVTGEGEILLTEGRSHLRARLKMAGLDLSKESTLPISLKADLEGESDFSHYSGSFRIQNVREGWQAARLSGSFQGNGQAIDISIVEGDLVGGTVKGRAGIAWAQGLSVTGRLEARKLNPSEITSDWKGEVNLDLDGRLTWPETGEPEGRVRARLLESRLHGRELTGGVAARLDRGWVRFDRIDLHGKGFDLSARGTLNGRFDFAVDVSNLSGVIPGTEGEFQATGWVRSERGGVAGSLAGKGRRLSFAGIGIGSIDLSAGIDDPRKVSGRIRARAEKITYRTIRMDAAHLEASGRLPHHSIVFDGRWPEGEVQAALEAGYEKGNWQGRLLRLSGKDRIAGPWSLKRPAAFSVSSQMVKLGSFIVTSSQRETLTVDGDLVWAPLSGSLKAEWQQVNLARLNPFLRESRLTGQTTGGLQARWSDGVPMELTGTVTFSGSHTFASRTVRFSEGNVKLRWDHAGLEGLGSLVTEDGGELAGKGSSPQPYRMAWPEQGKLEASWKSIDLTLLQSRLPSGLSVEGRLSGRVSGNWYDKGRFDGSGTLSLGRGVVRLRTDSGLIQDDLSKADLEWSWKEDGVRGNLLLSLARYGSVQSQFQFPVAPQFPIIVPSRGPVQLSLEGHLPEMGLLKALLPRLVQDSHGKAEVEVTAKGTLDKLSLKGSLGLSKSEVILLLPSSHVNRKENRAALAENPPQEKNLKINVPNGRVDLEWSENRLDGSWTLALAPGGRFRGTLSSTEAPRLSLPARGKMDVSWESLDLKPFQRWFPAGLDLEAKANGQVSLNWNREGPFDVSGDVRMSSGLVRWKTKDGVLTDTLQKADLRWAWKGEELRGNLSLSMARYGLLESAFQLPLVARFPVIHSRRGSITASVRGRIDEKGLLAILLPELIEESRGNVDLLLNLGGTWEKPTLRGRISLDKASLTLLTGSSKQANTRNPLAADEPSSSLRIDIAQSLVGLDWNGKGLTGSWEMALNPTGKLQAVFSSSQPMRFGFPESGKLTANWEAIDLQFVRSWIPRELALEGSISGQIEGQWLPGARMDLSGDIGIAQGNLRWEGREGTVNAALRTADLRWVWRNEDLRGTLSLALADYGSLEGRFQLPLPARLPLTFRSRDSFDLSIQGRFKEEGLVSALFPGLVQDSQSQIDLQLRGAGRWESPLLEGRVTLTQAKAYLPGAGIRMETVKVEARLGGNQIQVTDFRMRSGPGYIEGDATLELRDWSIKRFQGQLRGERFQTVDLPEIQILSSPRLEFEGTKERISVRGDIQIPELMIRDRFAPEVVRPSKDVVIVDAPKTVKREGTSPVDLNVRVLLGNRVFVRMKGANVRLTGQLALRMVQGESITASGEIRVAEGYYIAFGQRLEISRGIVSFKGPLDRPDLDVLATRKVKGAEEVTAGVIVTGDLQSPVVRLYSHPAMPETDILSYIVLGEPLAKGKTQTNTLSAAGAILSAGESVILQNRVREILGSDTLGSESEEQGTVARSIAAIGKHIRERVYVSLGGTPFTDSYLITLRYTLSKRWEIETKTGSPESPSGATLYYKIDFK